MTTLVCTGRGLTPDGHPTGDPCGRRPPRHAASVDQARAAGLTTTR